MDRWTSAATLQKLYGCNIKNVSFDLVDMFGGPRKILSLEKIYNDIVVKNRGGFCYENNALFYWLLKEIGFEANMMQAQLWVKATNNFCFELDHMCLMVRNKRGLP